MGISWGGLFVMLAVFFSGWKAHDWQDAKTELAASQSADKTRQIVTDITGQFGQELESKLSELRANENHTEKVIHTETVKPVFSNICASDEYVRLLNENIDKASRTLSGKPANAVHGSAAAP